MLSYQQQNQDPRWASKHVHNCRKQFVFIHFSGVDTPRVIQSNLQLARLVTYLLCIAPRKDASPCMQEHWGVCSTGFP